MLKKLLWPKDPDMVFTPNLMFPSYTLLSLDLKTKTNKMSKMNMLILLILIWHKDLDMEFILNLTYLSYIQLSQDLN